MRASGGPKRTIYSRWGQVDIILEHYRNIFKKNEFLICPRVLDHGNDRSSTLGQ